MVLGMTCRFAIVLAAGALGCGGCAVGGPSPLSIETSWERIGVAPTPRDVPAENVPAAVVVRWRDGDFTRPQIDAMADSQCSAVNRIARPDGDTVVAAGTLSQVFRCVPETLSELLRGATVASLPAGQ